jgi:hypothetical protein
VCSRIFTDEARTSTDVDDAGKAAAFSSSALENLMHGTADEDGVDARLHEIATAGSRENYANTSVVEVALLVGFNRESEISARHHYRIVLHNVWTFTSTWLSNVAVDGGSTVPDALLICIV